MRRTASNRWNLYAGLVSTLVLAWQGLATTVAAERPNIQTGENYVEEVLSSTSFPVEDPRALFATIFATLGDRVNVYPTENYYYFSFFQNGVRYRGNIRLSADDRDEGKLHFGYFEEFAEWRPRAPAKHLVLDIADGVRVEPAGKLAYAVTFRGKHVVFALNDLSAVYPPALAPHEKFIGPVFDESAMRFYLLFDQSNRTFRYVLDEAAAVPDELTPISETDRILIGKRTGFAYYRDHRLDRKILVGVHASNVEANNYLDGPFDQLPDNFIQGDSLRQSIVAAEPSLAGKIDRFGTFRDGSGRYLIAPYLRYRYRQELVEIHTCAMGRVNRSDYYDCFSGQLSSATAPKSALRR